MIKNILEERPVNFVLQSARDLRMHLVKHYNVLLEHSCRPWSSDNSIPCWK
jgi:hypothetical protein